MEIVTGIFNSRSEAERVVEQLRSLGISEKRIGVLTPGMTEQQVERSVSTTDSEGPGMGKTMGAAVGGALGVAGGTSLGLAAATLLVPGVGPVLALGLVGAALLGLGGVATGAAVGEALEENLGEGLPHEELYIYEEALRRGRTVVLAFAEDSDQADRARDVLRRAGSEDIDELRESWWRSLRDEERSYYHGDDRDFDRDELSYRHGFQAALHPRRRGKAYAEVERELIIFYGGMKLDSAFRHGFERGQTYLHSVREMHKV